MAQIFVNLSTASEDRLESVYPPRKKDLKGEEAGKLILNARFRSIVPSKSDVEITLWDSKGIEDLEYYIKGYRWRQEMKRIAEDMEETLPGAIVILDKGPSKD